MFWFSKKILTLSKYGHEKIRVHEINQNQRPSNILSILHIVNRTEASIYPGKTKKTDVKILDNDKISTKVTKQRTPVKQRKGSRIFFDQKTIGQVTALFSNTFYNIFGFSEKRPAPVKNQGDAKELKSNKISYLAQDYEAAYEDYISSIIGNDLESAVNGNGNNEYYYSDDYPRVFEIL